MKCEILKGVNSTIKICFGFSGKLSGIYSIRIEGVQVTCSKPTICPYRELLFDSTCHLFSEKAHFTYLYLYLME